MSAEEDHEAVLAHQRTFGRMLEPVRDKRKNPGRDVPSALQAHPVGLTDEEIATDLLVTMAAGYLNTGCWMGNTIRLMLTDNRFAVPLSGGPSSVGQALNEVLWEDSPTQNFVGRWATQDTQLGGKRIRKATWWSSGRTRRTPIHRCGPTPRRARCCSTVCCSAKPSTRRCPRSRTGGSGLSSTGSSPSTAPTTPPSSSAAERPAARWSCVCRESE